MQKHTYLLTSYVHKDPFFGGRKILSMPLPATFTFTIKVTKIKGIKQYEMAINTVYVHLSKYGTMCK